MVSALRSGRRGPRFKSGQPDSKVPGPGVARERSSEHRGRLARKRVRNPGLPCPGMPWPSRVWAATSPTSSTTTWWRATAAATLSSSASTRCRRGRVSGAPARTRSPNLLADSEGGSLGLARLLGKQPTSRDSIDPGSDRTNDESDNSANDGGRKTQFDHRDRSGPQVRMEPDHQPDDGSDGAHRCRSKYGPTNWLWRAVQRDHEGRTNILRARVHRGCLLLAECYLDGRNAGSSAPNRQRRSSAAKQSQTRSARPLRTATHQRETRRRSRASIPGQREG